MKYFVTYCVQDSQIANPLWHACLILSSWPGEDQKIEVTNAWGFYPAPGSSSKTWFDTFLCNIKKKVGYPFDLQGNHGLLKQEEMRYLDLGYGLRGVTIEISREQFERLEQICVEKRKQQEEGIVEAKKRLATQSPDSLQIYQEELRLAHENNCSPRLDPFDFHLSVSVSGISLNKSFTCKTMAIQLLQEIEIEQEHLDRLTQYNSSTALPRMSGDLNLETIFLHSTGPRQKHTSERTGKMTLFRAWQENHATQLFWSLPPQLFLKDTDAKELFAIPDEYVPDIKDLICKLQKIEKVVGNVNVNTELDFEKKLRGILLAKHINNLYGTFAFGMTGKHTSVIEEKIVRAKDFLNNLYFAINDLWDDCNEVEAIASQFPQDVQQQICGILGRSMAKSTDAMKPAFHAG